MTLTLKTIKDRCDEVGSCWIWKQGCNSGGCPNARDGKETVVVRRRSWELHHGRAAKRRYFIVATCHHALCVSPECASELGGAQYIAFRHMNGSLNHAAHRVARTQAVRARSKLSIERAADLRARIRAGEDRGAVAQSYGITRNHANRVARGLNWQPQAFSVFNMAA